MSVWTLLGSGPEVRAMHIEVVPEAEDARIHRELAQVTAAIELVRTSKNSEYRTAALVRLERRARQLRARSEILT